MHNLMLMLAAVMPEEMILEEITEALTSYKIDPTKEAKQKLLTSCMLFASKQAAENAPKGVTGLMEDMDRMKATEDFLNPKTN